MKLDCAGCHEKVEINDPDIDMALCDDCEDQIMQGPLSFQEDEDGSNT